MVHHRFRPTSAEEARDVIRWAVDEGYPLELLGTGTKASLGRSLDVPEPARVDLSGLSGIVLYEPEELVITLRPGTPLAEVEEALAANGQMLAFEPPDLNALWEKKSGGGTIGGVIATSLSGPRRARAGGVRDFVLGVKGVSGFGQAFKSGGRVVKNVTGYDLSKLMCGSYGTLAALTEVTLKVLPRPATAATVVLFGLDPERAWAALNAAASSPHEPSGLSYIPAQAARNCGIAAVADRDASLTTLRLEGPAVALEHRIEGLKRVMPRVDAAVLGKTDTAALWRSIRDVHPLIAPREAGPLWRVCVPPSKIADFLAANPARFALCDWAGGLVWLIPEERSRPPTLPDSGWYMLVRAAPDDRARLPAFSPLSAARAALANRIKSQFDPNGILNPGRLYERSP